MIYFDVTDVVHFATRYNRLTGIQRVQVNIVGLLARKHGAAAIRCVYYDADQDATFEFNPVGHFDSREFDAESFFAAIGGRGNGNGSRGRFPSKVQVKSYLRRYNNNKLLRTLKKMDVYISALIAPNRLESMGLSIRRQSPTAEPVVVAPVGQLPLDSSLVCMGAMWLHPQMWRFAQAHRSAGGDMVQMVHDLIPVVCPQYFTRDEQTAFDTWLRNALRYASRFITVSQYTAGDLRNYASALGESPEIRAIPLAHEFMGYERFAAIDPSPQLAALDGVRFVVCVGTIEHRKNAIALLNVWNDLLTERSVEMPLLVFAGKFGSGSADFQKFLAKHQELAAHVRIVHSPSDRELAWLYANSLFTAMPSLIEGWGLPVGEGAWFGKFCVASRATSIPEVCGDLMEYVDPKDVGAIKSAIRRAIAEPDYLARRELAIRNAELRRWENVADDIFAYVADVTASAQRSTTIL